MDSWRLLLSFHGYYFIFFIFIFFAIIFTLKREMGIKCCTLDKRKETREKSYQQQSKQI
jgi:hypothetical protein